MTTKVARFALAALLTLAAAACGGDEASKVPRTPIADGTVLDGTYQARCGCALDGIGECGNYVLVDGAPVELTGDLGLGEMEFCGQDDRSALVKGTVTGGSVQPTAFELKP